MAEKAGKAAPAMAIAGALVAAPQAQHAFARPAAAAAAHLRQPAAAHAQGTPATLDSIVSRGSAGAAAGASTSRAVSTATRTAAATYYRVRTGDTLSQIAGRYYHNAGDWPWLYHENDTIIKDPNLIYTGQVLRIPADPPASAVVDSYIPRHAKPAGTTVSASAVRGPARSGSTGGGAGDSDDSGGTPAVAQPASQGNGGSGGSGGSAASRGSGPASGGSGSTTLSGTLGCSGLEQLWVQAGGNPASAFMAAEIAMAESGGNQYALSPTNDYGYWQINASNGALATFSAYGNARAAVMISRNGTNWNPWTTYTSGAYAGRC